MPKKSNIIDNKDSFVYNNNIIQFGDIICAENIMEMI